MPLESLNEVLTADIGSIFVQEQGPGPHDLIYLGCHELGDVDSPLGDVERTYCPDPSGRGKYRVVSRSQGAPGELPFTIEIPLGKVADELEQIARTGCAVSFYVVYNACVRRDMFQPFDRGFNLQAAALTNVSRASPATRSADGGAPPEATKTFSYSAKVANDFFNLMDSRKVTTNIYQLNDIAACTYPACGGPCGPADYPCHDLWAVANGAALVIANVLYSNNYGVTWAATAALPFIAAENISSVVCFSLLDGVTTRVIVSRGSTDVANPAEIAYTDSPTGAAWTLVNVGATNGEFMPRGGCLFALDGTHIWACTDTGLGAAGGIYFSNDYGAAWTLQTAAGTDALNCIKFADANVGLCVGDTNEILFTTSGGVVWVALAGPAAQAAADALSCVILDEQRFYVGYDDGEIWYTENGGATWTECTLRTIPGYTYVDINDMAEVDDHCIWACGTVNDGADNWGVVLRTVSGSGEPEQWEYWLPATAMTAAPGMLSVVPCHYNRAFSVGNVETTAYILEVAE